MTALLLILALAGCFPAPHGGYYRPSSAYEGAEVRRHSCGGQVGPEDVILLHLHGAALRMRFEKRGDGLYGHTAITVGPNARLRILDGPFVFESADRRVEVRPPTLGDYDSTARKPVDRPIGEAIDGPTGRSLEFLIPAFAPGRFRLTLPPLEVNGRTKALPPVEFDYRIGDFGIYPFNC